MSRVILFPRPTASAPPAPRLASPEECPDLERTLQILHRGLPEESLAPATAGMAWEKWCAETFPRTCAPHLLRVFRAAVAGKAAEIVSADAAFPFPGPANASADADTAAVPLRAWQDLSVILPAARRLASAVEAGTACGHLLTLFACRAAAFHFGELLLLQAALFSGWQAASSGTGSGVPKSPDEFLRASRPAWDILPRLLHSNDAPATPRSTSRRRAD